MSEFVLIVRNEIEDLSQWSSEQHQQFLAECEEYVGNLTKEGKIQSSHAVVRERKIMSGSTGERKKGPLSETNELIVGYYRIFSEALDDAIMIAKGNPAFEYLKNARIEVHPV